MVHGWASSSIAISAYTFGVFRPSCSTLAYVYGWNYNSVSIDAYTSGAYSTSPISINAYVHPIEAQTISIRAFVNTEDFIDPNGNPGFGDMYGEVVLTDLEYNRVTTLVCDYYLANSTAPIVWNLLLVNGTRYNTSNVKLATNSAWSGRVTIQHGLDTQYLTDSYNTTATFTNMISPNNAMPVAITIIEPGVSVLTIIPIYIVNGV